MSSLLPRCQGDFGLQKEIRSLVPRVKRRARPSPCADSLPMPGRRPMLRRCDRRRQVRIWVIIVWRWHPTYFKAGAWP